MTEYHRTIIFTKTPLNGFFRYKDYFQIFPANLENMPYSDFQEDYPVILEYTTTETDKIEILDELEELKDLKTLTATSFSKQDQILNLLTLLSNHLFFRYTDLSGCWGIPLLNDNPGKEANSWSSKWNMKLFHWPELSQQLLIEKFSNLNIQEIKQIPHLDYYFDNPNFDFYHKKTITFPDTIINSLDSYYSLDIKSKQIIDNAINHIVSAIELRKYKKTLSIISAFTSIETMVNYESINYKSEKCESCNQLKFKVAQKFRDFLLKYIGESDKNKKKFNAFYSLRSKIIHTGE